MTKTRQYPADLKIISICVLLCSLMLAGFSGIRPSIAGAEAPRTILLLPANEVGLTIDLSGFTIHRDQIKPDGRRYVMAFHPATGLNVSVTLEMVRGLASTAGCLERLRQLQKGPFISRGRDVALTTSHDVQTLEYTLHEFQGVRLDQKSLYACIAEQNVYASIHLSKVQYTAADAALFHSVLKTIRLQPSRIQKVADQAATLSTGKPPFSIESVRYRHDDHAQSTVR